MGQYDAVVGRRIDSAETWHTILKQLPNPHPLQSYAWGLLKSRWGWSMEPTAWFLNEQPVAAAMLLKRQFPKTPFSMLYAPKGPVLDYANPELRVAIFARLAAVARSDRAILVKIDPDVIAETGAEETVEDRLGNEVLGDLERLGWQFSAEQIQFRNTVTLDLTQSTDDLLKAMKQKTRYNIRLATRREVTIREGTQADFEMLAEMYTTTSERNAFLIRPKSYYLDVWNSFHRAGMLHILIAEYENHPLAAVHIVHNHHTALYMYGASNNEERKRMPTYLLQWEAIQWAKSNGCRLYDFWGAPDDFTDEDRMWGVWKFKRGFNGTVARHIGAWDYPAYPLLYRLFTDLLPRYRARLRSR